MNEKTKKVVHTIVVYAGFYTIFYCILTAVEAAFSLVNKLANPRIKYYQDEEIRWREAKK